MPYKTFVIPALNADWAEHELNAFVGSHRVLAVDRQWVDQGENSFWAIWVDYLDSPADAASRPGGESTRRILDAQWQENLRNLTDAELEDVVDNVSSLSRHAQ